MTAKCGIVESYLLLKVGKVSSEFVHQEAMETLSLPNLHHLSHAESNSFHHLCHTLTNSTATQSMVTMDVISNLRREGGFVEVEDVNLRIEEDTGLVDTAFEEIISYNSRIM